MMEAIPLAIALFWDPNFLLCPWHILNLVKKLGLKMRSLKVDVVKERIGEIWANKTIVKLGILFTNNPDWWQSTAVIFAQPTGKNVKKELFYLFFYFYSLFNYCIYIRLRSSSI